MLTRLKVSGFKNLVDVDVRFGPFTCIAGANGVGKSNLFDAIRFLSLLADKPLVESAGLVRSESNRASDIRSLFHLSGDQYAPLMSFEAEMIVPQTGVDDLNQQANASITFLKYTLEIAYRQHSNLDRSGALEIIKEELVHINIGEAKKNLPFPHSPEWRKSVITGRRGTQFISTTSDESGRTINQHQDGGSSGRPYSRLAANLPRTVLSTTNAAETPTALLAKREMQSWRLLQLEPSALRRSDEFRASSASDRLGLDGAHLAATIYRLANSGDAKQDSSQVYTRLSNRLFELINEVRELSVDFDEKRQLLTIQLEEGDGTVHPARALSDGTLRFLALAVLQLDPQELGVLCLEEPENGIHPKRIKAMLDLLQDIATDPTEPISEDNPLRQVIINTHSPTVVQQVPDDSLLIATLEDHVHDEHHFKSLTFSCLPDTWRQATDVPVISKGTLLSYLNPVPVESQTNGHVNSHEHESPKRVIDNQYVQTLLPGFDG